MTETATTAQVAYIAKLQAELAGISEARYADYLASDTAIIVMARRDRPALYPTYRDCPEGGRKDPARIAWMEARSTEIRAERQAIIDAFKSALTVDPETLTKTEASAVIDTLKAF